MPTKSEQAKTDYQKAMEQFENARTLAAGNRDAKQTAWIYQIQRSQAMLGLYLLSKQQGKPDAEMLTKAQEQVNEVRKSLEGENKPLTVDMAAVDQMDRALRQIQ